MAKHKMLFSLWSEENKQKLLSFRNIFCYKCNKQGMILNDDEIIPCSCKTNIWKVEENCYCGRSLLIHQLVNNKVIVYCDSCSIKF